MEFTIQINGQALSVEVSLEVYDYLDRAHHKDENLAHKQRRHKHIRAIKDIKHEDIKHEDIKILRI